MSQAAREVRCVTPCFDCSSLRSSVPALRLNAARFSARRRGARRARALSASVMRRAQLRGRRAHVAVGVVRGHVHAGCGEVRQFMPVGLEERLVANRRVGVIEQSTEHGLTLLDEESLHSPEPAAHDRRVLALERGPHQRLGAGIGGRGRASSPRPLPTTPPPPTRPSAPRPARDSVRSRGRSMLRPIESHNRWRLGTAGPPPLACDPRQSPRREE